MAKGQRDRVKERRWRQRIRRWQKSGLTIRDFCRGELVSEPSFYAWRREIEQRDQESSHANASRQKQSRPSTNSPTAFVPIHIVADAEPSALIEIVLSNGRVLRVPPGFDGNSLQQVVAILDETAVESR